MTHYPNPDLIRSLAELVNLREEIEQRLDLIRVHVDRVEIDSDGFRELCVQLDAIRDTIRHGGRKIFAAPTVAYGEAC